MAQDVVAADVAEAEFERFLEAMGLTRRIQSKVARSDAEDRRAFDDMKFRFLDAIQDGRLTIDALGQPVFTPSGDAGGPIMFTEPTGATRKATDQAKQGHNVEKTILLVSKWTNVLQSRLEKMKERDFAVIEAIVVLFFP
jgi:hypothetical protein